MYPGSPLLLSKEMLSESLYIHISSIQHVCTVFDLTAKLIHVMQVRNHAFGWHALVLRSSKDAASARRACAIRLARVYIF
jgi:hypothetical protein